MIRIGSGSVGDPDRFLSVDRLELALAGLAAPPRDTGRVALVVRRGPGGEREALARVRLSRDGGVPGDAWGRRRRRNPGMQLAVMQLAVAELIANGQPLALFGDNLFLDLDLSTANLPSGSRLRVGEAILEVTPMPHNGCAKFRSRFGEDALRFVSRPEQRQRNLRGIYMTVVDDGDVAPGDPVEVLTRAPVRAAGPSRLRSGSHS